MTSSPPTVVGSRLDRAFTGSSAVLDQEQGLAFSGAGDRGFVLLEEVVSISLLVIVMAALSTFFLTATQSTTYERARQSAIQLANTEMDTIRAARSGDLLLGRSPAQVAAQFAGAPTAVTPALAAMNQASDTTTPTLTLPASHPAQANQITYTVTNYLGTCSMPASTSTITACTATGSGLPYLRAVVAVTWPGVRCPAQLCTYVTATLLSAVADPVFYLNQLRPAAPVVTNPGPQTSVVGRALSLQMTMQQNTGVGPANWQISGLPAGLSMTTGGLITGTPTAATPAGNPAQVIVTVTDAFGRTATLGPSSVPPFTWTVYPVLVAAGPGTQTTVVNTTISPLTLTATGGTGGPYTWSDPNNTLPPGLHLSAAGVVTGAPSTVNVAGYPVAVHVSDGSPQTKTDTFTWIVSYPPLSTSPTNRLTTVGAAITPIQLSASGGSGTYTWADTAPATLPAGLSVSSSGLITGTPTAVGTSQVRIVVTDAQPSVAPVTAAFTWQVVAPPTVTGAAAYRTTAGAVVANQSLPYTCPTSSCSITLAAGAPPGIGLAAAATGSIAPTVTVTATSGTVYLRGTVSASAATSSPYPGDVTGQGASDYWRLGEAAGTTGVDSIGSLNLTEQAGVGHGAPGAITGSSDTASTFNGSTTGNAYSQAQIPAPTTFSEEIWFKTTSTTGGKLLGFGNAQTGASGSYDKHLYMDNAGHVLFGVYAGRTATVSTTATLNDGQWHQAVGTLSSINGISLFIDGALVGTDSTAKTQDGIAGYWRVGYDNLNGWPAAPSNFAFTGSLDEASIYPTALTAAQIQQQYTDALSSAYTVTVTPTDTTSGAVGSGTQARWNVYPQPTVTGLVTPFTTAVGSVISNRALPYTCPAGSCTYTLGGAPTGIGLSTGTTGTPMSSVTVSATSGAIFLRGTVSAAAAPGSYQVTVTPADVASGVNGPAASSAWTVNPAVSSTAYTADVTNQGAIHYWRLGESTGTTGTDSIGTLNLSEQAGITHGTPGAILTNTDTASTFDGNPADGGASTQTAITGPNTFSEEIWFKTTTTSGGKLLGFGNATTGLSNYYDRQTYMDNAGHLSFGVCASNACPVVLTTAGTYNDGQWHQAVGTLSSAGMTFYVDGVSIGTNTAITTGQGFSGYWRLGGDNLSGWPGTASSTYFAGTLDDASIYPTALTAAQIQQQYTDSGRTP